MKDILKSDWNDLEQVEKDFADISIRQAAQKLGSVVTTNPSFLRRLAKMLEEEADKKAKS